MKRLQNRIAESGLTLPIAALYALGVWLLAGVVQGQWWPQLLCFIFSAALMAELNNSNALIRVRSRMASATFLLLSSVPCFLFQDMQGGIVQLCYIASFLLLFHSYQDNQSMDWVYYSCLCIGLASLVFVQILFFLPLLWLLMATNLLSLSWRTWAASLLGVLTPYWFLCIYFIYLQDFSMAVSHFSDLFSFSSETSYASTTVGQVLVIAFIILLTIVGCAHFWRYSYEDKIRIRQLFGFFITTEWAILLFLVLQPQHYAVLTPLAIVNTSILIAHFLTLTHSRITNIFFFIVLGLAVLLTAYNLWMPSTTF